MKERNMEDLFASTPEMPEGLSKSNITEKIEKRNISPKKPESKKDNSFAFIAAIFAVLLVGALTLSGGFGRKTPVAKTQESVTQNAFEQTEEKQPVKPAPATKDELPEGVYTFESREQVEEYFKYVYEKNNYIYYVYVTDDDVVDFESGAPGVNEMAPESAVDVTVPVLNSSGASADTVLKDDYTGTNTQNSTDEGDIIKNDGRYLYIISHINMKYFVKIVDTKTMECLSVLEYDYNKDKVGLYNELYVRGDRLVVLYNRYSFEASPYVYYDYIGGDGETLADIYDISDRSEPKLLRTVSQDGTLLSSRMIGNVLYTVTRYIDFPEGEDDKFYCVPSVNGSQVAHDCIIHFDEENSWTYTVVTATDISDEKSETGNLSMLTNSTGLYCSENNLYLARLSYSGDGEKTLITKISLNGTEMKCVASGEIEGCYNDKYSFDEYEGMLRAVTTEYDYETFKNECHLYVLDENLEIKGKIDDITNGLDEQVKAVRFMGDIAYVVTFEQTDPLFVIDLSDEKNPTVKGELYMPGYSTYLHPVREGVLLGIGYGGDENSEDTSKLKIALYDVSDINNPKILDEFIINNGYTNVNYDAKALIHYPSKNIIGIPVTIHSNNGYGNPVKSFAIIDYSENKLTSVSGFIHDSEEYYNGTFRGTCIGENLYTIDNCAVIEHRLSDGEKLRACILATKEDFEYEINIGEYKNYTDSGVVVATTSAAYIPE